MHARDFLRPNEQALVIFTSGANLHLYEDARGTSGEWEVSPNRAVDRVIIYRRLDDPKQNEIYLATYVGTRPSSVPQRYFVDLAHIQYAGIADVDWYAFAGKGQNPIRYVRGEERRLQ